MRTTLRLLPILAFVAFLTGCASVALSAAGVDRAQVPMASGVWHQELLGTHFILDFAWIRDGAQAPAPPYVEVFSVRSADWSARFEAAESAAPAASAWFHDHATELRREFDAMVRLVHEAYPGEAGRRFRVLALPAGTRFDGVWPVMSRDGHDLSMTFALPLPLPRTPTDGESMRGVNFVLLHEFSHTYFWFHPEHYRNNFSDEVVAYIEQACLTSMMFPDGRDSDAAPLDRLQRDLAGLPPGQLYARYRGQYADTVLAYVAAMQELRSFPGGPSKDPGARELCRSLPTAGRDFTESGNAVAIQ